jgi:DNA-binding transcriptional MerR regulator
MDVKGDDLASRQDDGGGSPQLYSIGDLAAEFGISTRTIRFYEAKGLIGPERAGANRVFTRRDRARLILILRGKRLGFTLNAIAQYLDMYDADPDQKAQTQLLLEKVEAAIANLEIKRQDIDKTLAELADIRKQCLSQAKGGAGR